jgi:hypothetical protein
MNKPIGKNQFGTPYTTETFIVRAKETFGDIHDYSKVDYINMNTKVTIICPIHSEFSIQPSSYLTSTCGCPKCGKIEGGRKGRLTKENFLIRAVEVHGDKYGYEDVDFELSTDNVIIHCNCGTTFEQLATVHLSGCGCPTCASIATSSSHLYDTKMFVETAIKKHGNKFDYSLVNYTHHKDKIAITCKKHDLLYIQQASTHLTGKGGCPICRYEDAKPRWSKSEWVDSQKGRISKLYVVKFKTENVEFIKIGITHTKINKRLYPILKKISGTMEQIKVIESSDANKIYELELESKRSLKEYKFTPDIAFSGKTECYKIVPEVLSYINNL